MKFLFILSSKAGRGKSLLFEEFINKFFVEEKKNNDVYILKTKNSEDAKKYSRKFAVKYQNEGIIYVCGGDGTANEVANQLIYTDCAMGILPFGTGNDFCKTIYGKKLKLEQIVNNIKKPLIKKIDMLKFNNIYAINAVSFGLDSVILDKALKILAKFNKFGSKAYYIAILMSLLKLNSYKIKFFYDGKENEEEVLLVAICNGKYYGNGFMPCPDASIDDGYLDVCIIKKINLIKLLKYILKYKKGLHIFLDDVIMLKTKHIKFISKFKIIGNYDGFLCNEKEYCFELIEKKLNYAFLNY